MVGIFKAEINGFDRNKLHIRAENKAVDDIVLGILRIVRIVGLIEQAAGWRISIVSKAAALCKQ